MNSLRADQKILPLSESREIVTYMPPPSYEPEPEQLVSFSHYAWLLRQHWWKILSVVVLCTTLTAVICAFLTPIYESTARVAIDNKLPSTALGQDPGSMQGGSDVDQTMNTEVQLIQSDAVLRPVAEQYHLLDYEKKGNAADLADAPVALKHLSVTRPPSSLIINISYRSADPRQAALVANAVAQSYINKGLEMRARSSMGLSTFMEKQIAELKKNMEDSEQALAGYEKKLGLINPDEKTSILSSRLMQLNTEYTEAENDRIRKEAAYTAILSGSLAALEVSPQADALSKLQEKMRAAQEKMVSAKTIYGPNYSEYKRAANELAEVTHQYEQMRADVTQRIAAEYRQARSRETILQAALAQAKGESDKLNANSSQYQQLKREAEANKALYEELFRKIKEAGINAGFQGSAIRIADEARPEIVPVFPNKRVFTFLGFLFSLTGSVAVIVLADMFDKSLRDPDQARRVLSTDVIGVLPDVRQFSSSKGLRLITSGDSEKETTVHPPKDLFRSVYFYEEAIDSLRSMIMVDRVSRKLHSIMITSAAPGEGKSTCAAHLAIAHAGQGRKTLLVDADLRCPWQHNFFGLDNTGGLADAVLGERELEDIPQQIEGVDNLYVMTAGSCPRKSFDLIGPKISDLMKEIGKDYDLVVIDAPPMAGLSEPIQIAGVADGVLVVTRAGSTNRQEITGVLSTLHRLRANVLAVVLNRVRPEMSPNYKSYGAYHRYVSRVSRKAS